MRLILFIFSFFLLFNCKNNSDLSDNSANSMQYAKGLIIENYTNYHKVTVKNIHENQGKSYTYILAKVSAKIPDSLLNYPHIQVPIKRLIATSTTHIPPLEMLGVEQTLVGFPNLDYISSPKTRQRINQNLVKNIGHNQSLDIENILLLKPDMIMGFGVTEELKDFVFLQEKGIPVLYNGEWREDHPLGKAEWLKLFGLLYGKEQQAIEIYDNIVKQYNTLKIEALKFSYSPTVMSGGVYENVWYAPKGESWGAKLIADAKAHYIWANEKGQGSLHLSFEDALIKAKNADFWIGPSAYESYQSMLKDNLNYKHFKAFQNKKLYSYTIKKGETGGIIYYESAVYQPHLILQDLINIFHKSEMSIEKLNYILPLSE